MVRGGSPKKILEVQQPASVSHKMRTAGDYYAITINPSIINQFFCLPVQKIDGTGLKIQSYADRQIEYIQHWQANFNVWKNRGYFQRMIIYLEISDNGLLHWHGVVKFNSTPKFNHFLGYYKYIKENYVNIEVLPIITCDEWYEYIVKDYSRMLWRYDSDSFSQALNEDNDMIGDLFSSYVEGKNPFSKNKTKES